MADKPDMGSSNPSRVPVDKHRRARRDPRRPVDSNRDRATSFGRFGLEVTSVPAVADGRRTREPPCLCEHPRNAQRHDWRYRQRIPSALQTPVDHVGWPAVLPRFDMVDIDKCVRTARELGCTRVPAADRVEAGSHRRRTHRGSSPADTVGDRATVIADVHRRRCA